MVVKLKTTLQKLQGLLQASGRFGEVTIGEPKDPPDGVHGAIFLSDYGMPMVMLNGGTVERRTVTVRVYLNALREPRGDIEFLMDDIVSELLEDFCGDYDLGSTVRDIEPTGIRVTLGYQTIGEGPRVMYRIADITLPLTIDDSATFAQ
jgi:hypothetical protein